MWRLRSSIADKQARCTQLPDRNLSHCLHFGFIYIHTSLYSSWALNIQSVRCFPWKWHRACSIGDRVSPSFYILIRMHQCYWCNMTHLKGGFLRYIVLRTAIRLEKLHTIGLSQICRLWCLLTPACVCFEARQWVTTTEETRIVRCSSSFQAEARTPQEWTHKYYGIQRKVTYKKSPKCAFKLIDCLEAQTQQAIQTIPPLI